MTRISTLPLLTTALPGAYDSGRAACSCDSRMTIPASTAATPKQRGISVTGRRTRHNAAHDGETAGSARRAAGAMVLGCGGGRLPAVPPVPIIAGLGTLSLPTTCCQDGAEPRGTASFAR